MKSPICPPTPSLVAMAKKSNRLILTGAAIILASHEAHAASVVTADFTLWQEYSVAPSFEADTVAGWQAYVNNIRQAATSSGFVSAGDPSTPGYFALSSVEIPLSQWVSSGPFPFDAEDRIFNSWHGQANPGAAFGAAFANEYGTFLHTPLLLVTTTGPITVTSINRTEYSEALSPGVPWFGPVAWTTWSAARIGVTSYGGNGVLGGGDDSYTTIGTNMNTVPVLAVIATGAGISSSISVQSDFTPWPISMPDEQIYSNYFNQVGNQIVDFRVDYTVNYTKGGGPLSTSLTGSNIDVVPEPSTLGFAAAACLSVLMRRRSPKRES
jgi:hypothetical protein